MKLFALNIPQLGEINVPGNVPTAGEGTLQKIISNTIVILFVVSIILALIFLIWGGIQWSSSGGNKEAIQKARQKITFAIIGLVIILLAFFIIGFIGGLFGTNLVGNLK
ncbi:MAG: efflux RND transporter permease subunit [Patescibacteria group bacterium]|nr:efflux RND transporter permease subunit [Patescibacteria group bacterium]